MKAMKKFAVAMGLTLGLVAAAASVQADDYYTGKNVTLYCAYSAGGSSDLLCRMFAARLSQHLGTTVTVENVTGAAGWVCWTQMLENTPADGYSFCLINTPNVSTAKLNEDNPMKYDHTDFDVICNQVADSNILAIRTDDDRFSDWDSFVEYWKEEGYLLTSASGLGIESDDATCANLTAKDLDLEVDIIASEGAGDNVTFLLNGTTDFLVGNVSEVAQAHRDGQFKVLCVFAEERVPALPDVPTYEELTGHALAYGSSRGYAMLKGTPEEAASILRKAVQETVQDEEMIAELDALDTTTYYVADEEYMDYLNQAVENAKNAYGIE